MTGGAREGAGRKKGVPNKNKAFLLKRLEDMYGADFDPIVSMCDIAMNPENDDTLKLSALKEVSQYLYPKLKSVEVTGDPDNPIATSVKIELVRPEEWK